MPPCWPPCLALSWLGTLGSQWSELRPLTMLDMSSSLLSLSNSRAIGKDFWGGEKARSQCSR